MQATLAIGEKILYPTDGQASGQDFYVTSKRILYEKSGLISRASTEIPLEQIGSIQISHSRGVLVSGIILLVVGALFSQVDFISWLGFFFILIGIGCLVAGFLQKPTIVFKATNGSIINIQRANPESLKQTVLDAKQLKEGYAPTAPATVREKETIITERQVMYCKFCGSKNEVTANGQFCQQCGGKL